MKLGDFVGYARKAIVVCSLFESAAVAEGILGAREEAILTGVLGFVGAGLTYFTRNTSKPVDSTDVKPAGPTDGAKN